MKVTLVAVDGTEVVVDRDIALSQSITLRDLSTDVTNCNRIEMPSIKSGRVLKTVCSLMCRESDLKADVDFIEVVNAVNYLNMKYDDFFAQFVQKSASHIFQKGSIAEILQQARKLLGVPLLPNFDALDDRIGHDVFPYEDLILTFESTSGLLCLPKDIIRGVLLPALDEEHLKYMALLHPLLFQMVLDHVYPTLTILPTNSKASKLEVFSAWLNSKFLSHQLQTKDNRKSFLVLTDSTFRFTKHLEFDDMNICLNALLRHDGFKNINKAREKRQMLSQKIRNRKEEEKTRKRQRETELPDFLLAFGFTAEAIQMAPNIYQTSNETIVESLERAVQSLVWFGRLELLAKCTTAEKFAECVRKYTPL